MRSEHRKSRDTSPREHAKDTEKRQRDNTERSEKKQNRPRGPKQQRESSERAQREHRESTERAQGKDRESTKILQREQGRNTEGACSRSHSILSAVRRTDGDRSAVSLEVGGVRARRPQRGDRSNSLRPYIERCSSLIIVVTVLRAFCLVWFGIASS